MGITVIPQSQLAEGPSFIALFRVLNLHHDDDKIDMDKRRCIGCTLKREEPSSPSLSAYVQVPTGVVYPFFFL